MTKSKQTKIGKVQAMLRRPKGTTVDALSQATGWQTHSVRAALSRLRKAGHQIERIEPEHKSPKAVYRIVRDPSRGITMTVAEVETMDRAALVSAWSELFRTPVPKGLSKAMMRRFLAVEIQTRRYGGLPKKTEAALNRSRKQITRPSSPGIKPGGRLLREWNGVTHSVEVTDTGFEWRGRTWRSLSAIAREITGAHWSGPRFFGLAGVSKK